MQYCSHVIFFSILLLSDLANAKIYKFDFRIRGLVMKLACKTSSCIRAICFVLRLVPLTLCDCFNWPKQFSRFRSNHLSSSYCALPFAWLNVAETDLIKLVLYGKDLLKLRLPWSETQTKLSYVQYAFSQLQSTLSFQVDLEWHFALDTKIERAPKWIWKLHEATANSSTRCA